MPTVPRQDTQVLGPDGKFTLPWYGFFRDGGAGSTAAINAEIAALQAAVLSLQANSSSFVISAVQSVRSLGIPANGVVSLFLENDEVSPDPSHYYGTDEAGAKGFHPLPISDTATITIPAAAFQYSQAVAAPGITSDSVVLVSLAPAVDADDNDPEMLDVVALWATPGTDEITFGLTFDTPTVGPVKLNWSAF